MIPLKGINLAAATRLFEALEVRGWQWFRLLDRLRDHLIQRVNEFLILDKLQPPIVMLDDGS